MVGAISAGRRLRAVIAVVVVAGPGSAHAARTPDRSDAGSGVATREVAVCTRLVEIHQR